MRYQNMWIIIGNLPMREMGITEMAGRWVVATTELRGRGTRRRELSEAGSGVAGSSWLMRCYRCCPGLWHRDFVRWKADWTINGFHRGILSVSTVLCKWIVYRKRYYAHSRLSFTRQKVDFESYGRSWWWKTWNLRLSLPAIHASLF
jgi:hypothetical protein